VSDRSIPLFKVFGIPIRIDLTWFIIFALVAWTLASTYFPMIYRNIGGPVYWVMGAVASLMLFVSVLLHELGHSYAAQRLNIPVRGITLFLFGGVSETLEEPRNATAELVMTLAGWGVSGVLAVTFFAVSRLFVGVTDVEIAAFAVVRYVAWINLLLLVFNGLPGLPLDGGRLLRAGIWYFTGNIRKATYIASSTGSFFGVLLIITGVFMLFTGNLIGGMWFILIGFFLRSGAKQSYQQLVMRRALEGVRVGEVMTENVVTVPARMSVQEAVNQFFMKYHYHSFPVMDNGSLVGIVSLHNVRELDRDAWPRTSVAEITYRDVVNLSMHKDDDVMDAMARMARFDVGRLPVVEDGRMVGIVTRRDIIQILSVKTDLGE
jgi:Zn-dependent protease/predicted transcriptional regulator